MLASNNDVQPLSWFWTKPAGCLRERALRGDRVLHLARLQQMNQRGFTLVEMGLVVTIAGLLLASVLVGGRQLIRQADRKTIIAQVANIKAAVGIFRDRYHMLPGDFKVATASPEIQGLSSKCTTADQGLGNGNGLIDDKETNCVVDQLVLSGVADRSLFATKFPEVTISLLSVDAAGASTGLFRTNVRNLIVFGNLPCYLATAIDEAMDDGDLTSASPGKAAVINGVCSSEDAKVQFAIDVQ